MYKDYFTVKENGISSFQLMMCYVTASSFSIVFDNPISVYRQMIQQSSEDPKFARHIAHSRFREAPLTVGFTGITPRFFGILLKKFPVFGILSTVAQLRNEHEISPTTTIITGTLAAIVINPVRFIEKQQRSNFLKKGEKISIFQIVKDSSAHHFKPFFRGIVPHMGHSVISSLLGLCGQPLLQKYIAKQFEANCNIGEFGSNILASCCVSPIYVVLTNPITRMEVMMQTAPIRENPPTLKDTARVLYKDYQSYGIQGFMRGQAVGIVKATIHLSVFHQIRMILIENTKMYNSCSK